MFKKIVLTCAVLFAASSCAHQGFFGTRTITEPVYRDGGRVVCAMALVEKSKKELCICLLSTGQPGAFIILPSKKVACDKNIPDEAIQDIKE